MHASIANFCIAFLEVDIEWGCSAEGGNEIVKLLGREGAMLDSLRVLEVRLSKLSRLPFSRETLLGDCLHAL